MTNHAQLSYTGLANPKTASVNVQMPGGYLVKVDVYNEAGELVKELFSNEEPQPISSFNLSQNGQITGLNTPVTLMVAGNAVTVWDGTNGSGDPVSNGNYYVKVQNTDAYGVVTTVTQISTVSRSIAKVQVDIFNEAGEVVRHLYAYEADSNNSQLTNFQLSANVLSVGNDQGPVSGPGQATIVLNTGVTLTWDGRSDSGALVTGGHYEIEGHFTNGKGQESVIAKGILVQNDQNSPTNGKIYAEPNILKGTTQTTLVVNSSLNLSLDVKVYDVAGEKVWGRNLTSNNNQFGLTLPGLSSGLYFVVVEMTDVATGHREGRQVTQIVVQR